MPRLRKVPGMCSIKVAEMRICGYNAEEKILCRTPFRSGHMSAICARLGNKGKVGVQRGRETAGVPSFLPPRRAPRRSRRPQTANPPAEVQRKTFRPLGANTLTQFEYPAQPVQKRRRPVRANTLTQFARPAQPVQEKEPHRQAEPACGSSCAPLRRCRKAPDSTRDKNFQENMRYPLAKYAKIGYYIQALFCMNSRMMLNDVKNTIIWRHSDYDRR